MALVIKNNEPAIDQSKIAVPGKKMKLKNSKKRMRSQKAIEVLRNGIALLFGRA